MPEKPGISYARGKDKLLNKTQVCNWLGIGKSTFYRLANEGRFGPIYRIGESMRVSEAGVEAFLRESKEDPLG